MNTQVQQVGHISGRSMTFVAVMGLHALVIAALMLSKFTPVFVDQGPPRMTMVPIPYEPVPPEPQPIPPEHKQKVLKFDTRIPVPDLVNIPRESESPLDARPAEGPLVESTTMGDGEMVPVVGPPAKRIATALQFQATRPTEDYYPETSRMLEEQGVTVIRVCADASGKLAGLPTVQSGSGSRRLDQAALRWARESLRFTPATDNGVAVPACMGFRVDFTLR